MLYKYILPDGANRDLSNFCYSENHKYMEYEDDF